MELFVFILLMTLNTIISGGVSFVMGGPGVVGICGASIPLVCGAPAGLLLFLNPAFKRKFQGKFRFILPAFIPIIFASMFVGLLMYDQNPRIMFKRLLSNPIPEGISNIQSYDDSAGFDVEYGLAFEATPEAVDYIIAKNGFKFESNDSNHIRSDEPPFEYFPYIKQNQEWLFYSKADKEHESVWLLWVNVDKNTVLFRFIGY
jgi:hypothetical protein